MKIVPLKRPDGCREVADKLRLLADRAEAGEFNQGFLVLFTPDAKFLTSDLGLPKGCDGSSWRE